MSYASTSEIIAITGSQLDTVTVQAILDEADRQIKSRISDAGEAAPASDDSLKSACLSLSKAIMLGRIRTDGSNVTEPQYVWKGDELNRAICQLTDQAWAVVDSYISASVTDRHYWTFRKVNQ